MQSVRPAQTCTALEPKGAREPKGGAGSLGRLVLHIGYPKAGSSALQTALLASRPALRRQRLIFPDAPSGLCNAFAARFAEAPETLYPYTEIADAAARAGAIARDIRRMVRWIENHRGDTAILSTESLIGLDATAVNAVRDWAAPLFGEVLIACYVREPVAYATSLTQERVKQGMTLAEACALTPTGNFAAALPRWVAAFGRESVRVRAIEALDRGDVVGDFAAAIGFDGALAPGGYANPALSEEAVRLLSAWHEHAAEQTAGEGRPAPEWLWRVPGRRFHLSEEMVARVQAGARPGLAYLAAEWDIAFSAPAVPAPAPAFGDATLRYLAGRLAR